MKPGIHPQGKLIKVHCACGTEFETYSTAPELRLEICGACHPYFTGRKRMVAARGRVEDFQKRYEGVNAAATQAAKDKKKAKKRR